MGKWEMVRLGDVCQFINGDRGVNYPSKKDFIEAGVPFINAGHLSDKSIDFLEMNYISTEKYMQLGSGKVRNGDILYCLRGSLGKQAIVKDVDIGAIASSLVIMHPLSKVAVKYLSYCLESSEISRQQLQANTGSSQPNLSATNVKNYLVPLPPLDEQKRIAKNLDLASEIVKGYKEQLSELDKLVQSVFYEMFGDPVTNEKGWEQKKIIELAEVETGGTPKRDVMEYYGGNIPWIKTGEISQGYISVAAEHIADKAIKKTNCKIFPIGTILMAMYGQGKTRGLAGLLKIEACTNQACAAILPSSEYLTEFLYRQLSIQYRELRALGRGGNQENLNLSMVKNFQVIAPPIPLQTRFASIVTEIEAQKALVQQALTEAQNLFNSLMQEYFE